MNCTMAIRRFTWAPRKTRNVAKRSIEQIGKDFTNMTIIGRPSTAEGAGKWEEDRIDTYKRNHGDDRPKYNQNDSGK